MNSKYKVFCPHINCARNKCFVRELTADWQKWVWYGDASKLNIFEWNMVCAICGAMLCVCVRSMRCRTIQFCLTVVKRSRLVSTVFGAYFTFDWLRKTLDKTWTNSLYNNKCRLPATSKRTNKLLLSQWVFYLIECTYSTQPRRFVNHCKLRYI